jgi:ribulose-5-phosphate 4-epimerase/fuculose-1-phosphate aldolase
MTDPVVSPVMDRGSLRNVAVELSFANRILARQRVVDTFGHVSLRSPTRPDRVFISRSLAPERVVPDDIVELDLDGRSVDASGSESYLERFIHTEIYRMRPDVQAVVHSHSPSVLPFTVVPSVPMRSICHTAGFIGHDVPLFEVCDHAGDGTDLLIRTPALGRALAAELADKPIILMRGHGSTTVGGSLKEAVFRAVYAEINARVQLESLHLGPVRFLSEAEARAVASSSAMYDRAWDMWTAQVAPSLGLDLGA